MRGRNRNRNHLHIQVSAAASLGSVASCSPGRTGACPRATTSSMVEERLARPFASGLTPLVSCVETESQSVRHSGGSSIRGRRGLGRPVACGSSRGACSGEGGRSDSVLSEEGSSCLRLRRRRGRLGGVCGVGCGGAQEVVGSRSRGVGGKNGIKRYPGHDAFSPAPLQTVRVPSCPFAIRGLVRGEWWRRCRGRGEGNRVESAAH